MKIDINSIVEGMDEKFGEDLQMHEESMRHQINESHIYDLTQKHGKNGFAIISASRMPEPGDSPEVRDEKIKLNKQNTIILKQDIKQTPFSFIPVYGKFVEYKDIPDENEPTGFRRVKIGVAHEDSFIVFNFHKKYLTGAPDKQPATGEPGDPGAYGEPGSMEKLIEFSIRMAAKFGQNSVLIKEPNEPPKYIMANGEVDFEPGEHIKVNKASEEYLTAFKKSRNSDGSTNFHHSITFTDEKPKDPTAGHLPEGWQFESFYLNNPPVNSMGRHSRIGSGEICL